MTYWTPKRRSSARCSTTSELSAVRAPRGAASVLLASFLLVAVTGVRCDGAVAAGPTGSERKATSVDLSFLNASERPAGKHGLVRASGDRLVFQDGKVARFWGTNLAAYAIFGTDREAVRREAHRLSQLGFNLVRIDHIDAQWVTPNIFGDENVPDTRNLDSRTLDQLDWWVTCLEDEGIYVWLDLEQGRVFKRGDGIDAFAEISRGKNVPSPEGYAYVNPSIQRAMQRFSRRLLEHRNPYTGRSYTTDPGIVAMLITNENDVTHHFGNALLSDKDVPWHNERYMQESAAFAASWRLPRTQVWRAWEPGPSKLFLNDLEQRFDRLMMADLRSLGVNTLIVPTSQWGDNPLSSLPALTTGDLIDVHAYGGVGEIAKNPLREATMVDWLAAAQVTGMPLSVSEWNVEPFPVTDRDTIPLYVAASGAMQGWDAVMQFAYSQRPLGVAGSAGNWEGHSDPALMATMPAAALLFRREDVRESPSIYAFAPSERELYDKSLSPSTSVALRTAVERGRLVVVMPKTRELPWLHSGNVPKGAKLITDTNEALISADAGNAASDTGELRRDWQHGIFAIDTPRTQAAMGRIGGKEIKLGDVTIALATRGATVSIQSLDAAPIRYSSEILISFGTGALPAGRLRNGLPGNKFGYELPFRSQPIAGRLEIRGRAGLKLYSAESPTGRIPSDQVTNGAEPNQSREVLSQYADDHYVVRIAPEAEARWMILK